MNDHFGTNEGDNVSITDSAQPDTIHYPPHLVVEGVRQGLLPPGADEMISRRMRVQERLQALAPKPAMPWARADRIGTLYARRLRDDSEQPAFQRAAYAHDCGLDLALDEELEILPGGTANVPTGVAVALPPGTFGWITGRSSTWSRHGLMVMPGIIDEGWRGELRVLVHRPMLVGDYGREARPVLLRLERGTRLAQLIILPNLLEGLQYVEGELPPGSRGEKGFGSSGS